jgi:hypothetical protein
LSIKILVFENLPAQWPLLGSKGSAKGETDLSNPSALQNLNIGEVEQERSIGSGNAEAMALSGTCAGAPAAGREDCQGSKGVVPGKL